MLHGVDHLMAIGEFSERSGLSAKRLRTYAAEGLLAPAAVDPTSGYRYYLPGQLRDALVIDALRQAGVPLADIRAFLRQPSREQLDAWARQLETDANRRHGALAVAHDLFASAMAGGGDVAAIVDHLINAAITHGGRDNVSVVVAEMAA